jgi:hypothetical protein
VEGREGPASATGTASGDTEGEGTPLFGDGQRNLAAPLAGVVGQHCLAVQVMQFSDGSYLEDQDHWWLAGE